jgi:cellulose 1,4-beta-cellobiosidase
MMLVVVAVFISGCGSSTPLYPTTLSATIGTGRVYLNWTPAIGAIGYNVYRGSASGPISTKTRIASNLTDTAYSDGSVLVGTNYYYQVTALNITGETASSNEVVGAP